MNRKEKIPKVPVVMQLEALECGAASLTMILEYYNKWIPIEEVRSVCDVSRDGANAANILKAGSCFGLECHGYRYGVEDLKTKITFPCIIHWNFCHFVVCRGFKNGWAYINDPAMGERRVSAEEFDKSFTGIVLTFKPGEDFQPEGKKRSFADYVKNRLSMSKSAIVFVVLTATLLAVTGLIRPIFIRIFYDEILTGDSPEWVMPVLIGLVVLMLLEVCVTAINARYSLRLNGKMDIAGSAQFMWRMIRMPMRFFSQRMAGDLRSRLDKNATISALYVNTFAPLILQGAMAVFYLVIMLRYSWLLTLVGVISIVLNLLSVNITQKRILNLNRRINKAAGKLEAHSLNAIEMIETIKSSGAERGYFEKWAGYQAEISNNTVKMEQIRICYGLLPQIIASLTNIVVSLLGVYLVMNGEFTLGMVTAFGCFLNSFMTPMESFTNAIKSIQDMRISAERVDDVMNNPIDYILEDHGPAKITEGKLKGKIELKDVTFGYARLGEPLLKNINITINPGEKIAFVGKSGCGKSTIANLISGLYEPHSGEILYDGEPITAISRNVFTDSLSVVDQDIILFEDTIRSNITMWDDTIPENDILRAAHDAQIHVDIMDRPGGYRFRISENGRDFSGGQRQRLEIARSLASNPTILIMDEATSALDAQTEKQVIDAVAARDITCIMIAHRLSTIRDCDRIYVMDNGDIVEQGTHQELLDMDGIYAALIKSA